MSLEGIRFATRRTNQARVDDAVMERRPKTDQRPAQRVRFVLDCADGLSNTAMVPASALQMHPVCTLIVDEPAAALLQRREYYRWVYKNKPAWQRA